MESTVAIVALWLGFALSHVGLSSLRFRPRLVAALGGEPRYQGLYSLVAFAFFVPLVWVYVANRHEGPFLWYVGQLPGMTAVMWVGMAVAFALVAMGTVRPSPAALVPGEAQVGGVYRITRHPTFMGVGVFGLVHLLVVPLSASDLAFFAGFPLFAVVGCAHQDQRKLATAGEAFQRFHAETRFLPFAGGGLFGALREQPVAAAVGVALAVGLRHLHPVVFG